MTNRFQHYVTEHMLQLRSPNEWRNRIKERLLHRYGKYLPSDRKASILEIGPGFGEFMELLAIDLGYSNIHGIDLSPEVAEHCNKILPRKVTVVSDSTAYLSNYNEQFDCIIMMHVIEHISKDQVIPLLQAVYKSLANDGVLLLETPNMANPFIGLSLRYADFTHEFGYTETSISYVLTAAGFRDIRVFESSLPPNHWARLAQKIGQFAIKGLITLIHRIYGSRKSKLYRIMSPELCVVARKKSIT